MLDLRIRIGKRMADTKGFVWGADISLLKRIEDAGGVFRANGKPVNALRLFSNHGFECMRLRLFHTPTGRGAQVNNLQYTLALAEKISALGMRFWLDFHYSDSWADPGKQIMPKAWQGKTHDELISSVFTYTRDVVTAFCRSGYLPDMVQVGNEVTAGFLWEDGRIAADGDTSVSQWSPESMTIDSSQERWLKFSDLIRAGIDGVQEATRHHKDVQTMIHIDRGGDKDGTKWFFDNLSHQDVDFNAIGLSYYPHWHGSLDDLKKNIAFVSSEYGKDVYIVETGYPWKSHIDYEELATRKGLKIDELFPYGISPSGQDAFLRDLISLVKESQGERNTGIFYWAPEWIELEGYSDEPDAAPCWARALFDNDGNALPGLTAYKGV